MRRRQFIAMAAGAVSLPFAARAQQGGPRRLGVLMGSAESDPLAQRYAAALTDGLAARDWRANDTLRIDWRWTGGDPALFDRFAAELVALRPDVLVAQSSPAVAALRRATGSIPIVFTMVSDPLGQGFVASLARPGGNVTGFTDFDPLMAGKWLELLTRITPPVTHVAVLYNPATTPYAEVMLRAIVDAAPSSGVTATAAPCRDAAEIEAMMAALAHAPRGGVLALTDIFNIVHRDVIVAAAIRHRLPVVTSAGAFTAAGGLMSYGFDFADLFRRAAGYVDRILKGAQVRDLPVQLPIQFKLEVNLKTARSIGITIDDATLATADEVIE